MAARNKALPAQEDRALREMFFGAFEGDTDENMQTAAAHKGGCASADQLMAAFSRGEISIVDVVQMIHAADATGQAKSYQQVTKRVIPSVKKIARQAQRQRADCYTRHDNYDAAARAGLSAADAAAR